MVTPCNGLVLLSSTGGPAIPGGPLRFGVPLQARMETPLQEVHPPGDQRPDLLGPTDAQRIFKNDADEDEGPLGVIVLP